MNYTSRLYTNDEIIHTLKEIRDCYLLCDLSADPKETADLVRSVNWLIERHDNERTMP
jgi:hypothetical protein